MKTGKNIDVEVKNCKICGAEFLAPYYINRHTGCGAYKSFCEKCIRERIEKQCAGKEKVRIRKESDRLVKPINITRPALTAKSLNSGKCVRCNGILELRDMKYEPDLSDALGNLVYYNCLFCGQDYYPMEGGEEFDKTGRSENVKVFAL